MNFNKYFIFEELFTINSDYCFLKNDPKIFSKTSN